jgi:hypothetical protein
MHAANFIPPKSWLTIVKLQCFDKGFAWLKDIFGFISALCLPSLIAGKSSAYRCF